MVDHQVFSIFFYITIGIQYRKHDGLLPLWYILYTMDIKLTSLIKYEFKIL